MCLQFLEGVQNGISPIENLVAFSNTINVLIFKYDNLLEMYTTDIPG